MKFNFLLTSLCLSPFVIQAQTTTETQKDSITSEILDEVLVQAVRANSKTPVAYSNLNKKELAKRNLGQDIPVLMNFMPSVVRSEEHTSELQSRPHLVCRLLL